MGEKEEESTHLAEALKKNDILPPRRASSERSWKKVWGRVWEKDGARRRR